MRNYTTFRWAGVALAASLLTSTAVWADPIVVGGIEIADAELAAAAKAEGNTFIMYHGWPEEMFAPIQAAFEADTGIKPQTVRLTSQNMHQRVTSEHAAGRLEADYVDLTDLVLLLDMVDLGIIGYPHRVPWFDELDEVLRDPEGRWYAGGLFTQILAVNTAIVPEAEAPTSWKQALDPKWKGNVGIPAIDAGGSSFTLFTYLRDQVGDNFWEKLAAQEPRIYPAVTPAVQNLVRGEFGIGLLGASTVMAQINAGAPLKMVFPEEGIAAFPVSGGITTSSKNPNSTAIWLNWLTSARAGDLLGPAGVYAVHPDAKAPLLANGIQFPEIGQVWSIDPELWSKVREPYSVEWRATFKY